MPCLPHERFEDEYVRPKEGRTLIVGSRLYEGREDRRLKYKNALGVDMLPGPGVDLVFNLEDTLPADLGKFSHIECWSVLEHSKKPWKLAANLQRLLVAEGTIHLTVPFVWRVHGYPNDYWRFTRAGVRELFPRIGWVSLCLAHEELKKNDLVLEVGKSEGTHPYLARTEVLGFGRLS